MKQNSISEFQREFNSHFPYLKLEFPTYRPSAKNQVSQESPVNQVSQESPVNQVSQKSPVNQVSQDSAVNQVSQDASLNNISANGKLIFYYNNRTLEIKEDMTITELKKMFDNEFGLVIKLYRKLDNFWLETNLTDGLTLAHQNQHGKDLS